MSSHFCALCLLHSATTQLLTEYFAPFSVNQELSIKLNFSAFDTQQYADTLSIYEGVGPGKILRGKTPF